MRRTLFLLLSIFLSLWLIGCGGSSSNNGGGGGGGGGNPSITISPTTANLMVGQSTTLTANVQNVSDTHVSWSVQEANGGTITTTNTGAVYTAPWPVGTYHVTVTSVANSSLTATATLGVSAKFGFIEEYPAGDALPWSMTPQLGTYAPDGSLTISDIIDQKTGNPVSLAMDSVTLSSDATLAAFDMVTDTSTNQTVDIYTAKPDGTTSPTQLTTDGASFWPQFSFDHQQILYMNGWDIWMMNADGTNQHMVFSSLLNNAGAWSATLSPDGTKIAAELEWYPDGVNYYDGIALMNADGTNAVALSGGADLTATCSSDSYDEMPAFTNDGTQIMFTRWCKDGTYGNEGMYVIHTDGTALAPLLAATDGVWHYNPLPVGNQILFQTNQDYPATNSFEIYSMKPDGSAVTRLTNNTVYDGFDLWYWSQGSASAQVTEKNANKPYFRTAARRAEKLRNMQQRRAKR